MINWNLEQQAWFDYFDTQTPSEPVITSMEELIGLVDEKPAEAHTEPPVPIAHLTGTGIKARDFYLQGVKVSAIAKQLDIKPATLKKYLKDAGIVMTWQDDLDLKAYLKLVSPTKEDLKDFARAAAVKRLLKEHGDKKSAVGQYLGISAIAVGKWSRMETPHDAFTPQQKYIYAAWMRGESET